MGDPSDEDTEIGPARLRGAARARRPASWTVRRATRETVVGGKAPDGGPASSSSRPWSRASQQDDEMIQREIFGPVVTVQRFSSEDEAIE